MQVELANVRKTYGRGDNLKIAVDDVSWKSQGGEIFGLLGPNGAGKTTMIRMMLDIMRPDSGQIFVDGDPVKNRSIEFKRRIGYLPEERGLYQKRKVIDVLLYFAALKGFDREKAKQRSLEYLERFGMADCANKRIHDLSKGMGQKIQIASCVLHEPELVVLDEPFSGLDPVNTRLIRETILELKASGKTVFLSTHMMSEVEALCDRIMMINHGQQVLYGQLDEIKKSFTKYHVVMDVDAETENLDCVASRHFTRGGQYLQLTDGNGVHDLMAALSADKRNFKRIEEASMPIEDIFVQLVGENSASVDFALVAQEGASS
jgi:ABC-2 type transport system ATP-binding protein